MSDLEKILQQLDQNTEMFFGGEKFISQEQAEKIIRKVFENRPKNLEITRMLTVSTAHVTQDTFERLALDGVRNEIGLPVYTKTSVGDDENYGLYIHISPDINLEVIPEDLMSVINLALDNGFDMLCLDSDGPQLENLSVFAWDEF